MKTLLQAYCLLIVNPIPVSLDNGNYQSLDLWVKDLETNLDFVSSLAVLAPRAGQPPESSRPILPNIKVIFQDQASLETAFVSLYYKN